MRKKGAVLIAVLIVGLIGAGLVMHKPKAKGGTAVKSYSVTQGVDAKLIHSSGAPYSEPAAVVMKKVSINGSTIKVEGTQQLSSIKGELKAYLPVGTYNMYLVLNGKQYCGDYSASLGRCGFTVSQGKVTDYTFTVNP